MSEIFVPSITISFSMNSTANMKMKYVFSPDTVSAKGLAKSSGRADSARDVVSVVPENVITVFWLFSSDSIVCWNGFDSGILRVRMFMEITIISTKNSVFASFSIVNFMWVKPPFDRIFNFIVLLHVACRQPYFVELCR